VKSKGKLLALAVILLVASCVLAGCSPAGPNPLQGVPAPDGHIATFAAGLAEGFIAPFTLAWSFIDPTVSFYDMHNNGEGYNAGFLFGFVMLFFASRWVIP